ncbi:HD domain-containing protein [Streptomyces sp. NPDC051940]|uniref:RelA/SpoT family protein n=1 Tax=Streptomyces sp. NPDC051940 TaxID=3155675 RepID=UPI00342814D8
MSAEASADAAPPAPPRSGRRGLPRLDLRRLGRAAAQIGTGGRDRLPDALEHVAKAHRSFFPDADLSVLARAYVLAEESHRGQMRKSGEPYITHPLAVTLILAELGAETTTLTASLLHDTVEDTDVTLEQVQEEFGAEVCYLVDGVTKLEKVDYGAAAEPETFRKMLVATGSDVRVMAIKLADRLHNMRTLGVMRREKQVRIAKVTRDVLIPLAERLGVQTLKTELEDLVFAILHPEEYASTRELVVAHRSQPDPLQDTARELRALLREADISAEVLIRPRHVVSVHRVLLKRGALSAADFGRLLVLVPEDADCYAVLGELHTCFTPVISEFKDFIAVPKFNLYQSLHTAVAESRGLVVEVLVRTHRMHRVAETGVVAVGSAGGDGGPVGEWLARLLDWQRAAPDPDTFWTALREDLAPDREITVFSDRGLPLRLPAGATCVDAAYAAHGEDAHACVGARVHGRLVSMGTELRDGDTLQLLLSPEPESPEPASGPSPEWLEHAQTPGARISITRWLAAHPADLEPPAPAVPEAGQAPAAPSAAPVAPEPDRPEPAEPAIADLPGAAVRLARCCTPVPPDAVTGFEVRGGAVAVHRVQCSAVVRMTTAGREPVTVTWREGESELRVTLHAEAFVRAHLLADLTEAIAAEGAAIVAADVELPREQRVRHTYTLQLRDPSRLPVLMRAMRRVPGVYDVSRVQRAAAGSPPRGVHSRLR